MTHVAGVLLLGCGHISHLVKMHYFFKSSFSLLSKALIRQTKYIVMMTKEGSARVANFTTPRPRDLLLERGHINHIVKTYHFFDIFSNPMH